MEVSRSLSQKDKICVKVFKPYDDADLKVCANEEYRVSQILRNSNNIVNVKSFEQQKMINIDGDFMIKDYLILEYCENSDLFEFMSNFAKMKNDRNLAKS